ncbi:MAG: alpha/beta hydrolase, partial [Candidatus Dormibacteraeota bacterium]|nr:alpha/beta hydrolase [Candidatus Dormibacteraeota bacterium]
DLVRGLVLFAPAFPPTDSPAPGLPASLLDRVAYAPGLAGRLGQTLMRARGARTVVEETLRRTSADFDALPKAFVDAHVEAEAARMRQPGAYVGYMQGWRWFHREFADRAGLERMVRSVAVPTILIQGTLDNVVLPQAGRRLAELKPGWTSHFLEGVGHNPNFESPVASIGLVRSWLREFAPG